MKKVHSSERRMCVCERAKSPPQTKLMVFLPFNLMRENANRNFVSRMDAVFEVQTLNLALANMISIMVFYLNNVQNSSGG